MHLHAPTPARAYYRLTWTDAETGTTRHASAGRTEEQARTRLAATAAHQVALYGQPDAPHTVDELVVDDG